MAESPATTVKTALWTAGCIGVILLAVQVLASTKVDHYEQIGLGLLTKLPIAFWIGFSCLGVLLYVSRKAERRTIIVVGLISFYLFGIPVLIRENKAEWLPFSYYRSAQGVNLLSEGHLDLGSLDPWDLRNWPGFYFFVAFLSSSTGLPASVLADYFPLLTVALLGVIAYSILRLQLSILYSSLGALWFTGSFWTSQHYFSPQGFAYVIYFAVLLLLAKFFFIKRQSIAFPLSLIFLFIGTVASHLLTSFMVLVGVIAIYAAYRILPLKVRTPPFYSIVTCFLLASIFISYQLLVTSGSFDAVVGVLGAEISRQETHIAAVSQTRIIGSTAYLLELVGTYSITITNVVIAILAVLATALGLLLHKKEARNGVFWVALIIVAGVFGLTMKYGAYEAIERAFMFMLLPTCYFASKFLGKKPRILILVLVVLIFIHIPAQYSKEPYFMIPTSELKGAAFYLKYVPPTAPFLYERYGASLREVDEKIHREQITILGPPPFSSLPSQEVINESIGNTKFILSSDLQKNLYLYFFGVDPLERLDLDDYDNRIYNNGFFSMYTNASVSELEIRG